MSRLIITNCSVFVKTAISRSLTCTGAVQKQRDGDRWKRGEVGVQYLKSHSVAHHLADYKAIPSAGSPAQARSSKCPKAGCSSFLTQL